MSLAGLMTYGSSDESDSDSENDTSPDVDVKATSSSEQNHPTFITLVTSKLDMEDNSQDEGGDDNTEENSTMVSSTSGKQESVGIDPFDIEDEDIGLSAQQNSGLNTNAKSSMFANLPAPQHVAPQALLQEDNMRKYPLSDLKKKQLLKKNEKKSMNTGKQPVKIMIPSLSEFEEEEEEKVVKKKFKPSHSGSALFSLLPSPKHVSVKESNRSLIPHTLTKKRPPVPSTQLAPSSVRNTKSNDSVTRVTNSNLISYEDSDEEDGAEGGNPDFFLLKEKDLETLHPASSDSTVIDTSHSQLTAPFISDSPLQFVNRNYPQEMPLNFKEGYSVSTPQETSVGSSSCEQKTYQCYEEPVASVSATSMSGGTQQLDSTGHQSETEVMSSDQVVLDNEALLRLRGKRRHQQEEISFIDVNEDTIRSDPKEWMIKQLTEEKETRRNSHRKKEGPTSQQKRKHQITYLAFQAKERELELKNQWTNNRMTKAQIQAKYGF